MSTFRRLPLAVLMIMAASAVAQPSSAEIEIRSLLSTFLSAAGRNDRAVFDRFFADDLVYTRSAGVVTSKAEIMKSLPPTPTPEAGQTDRYRADDINVQIFGGDTAVVTFRLVQSQKRDGEWRETNFYRNTGTFVLRDGRWQVVAWQATRIPEKQPETKR